MLNFSTFRHALVRWSCIFTFTLSLLMMSSCSKEKKPRTPINEIGLDKYVFRALDINFEFEFEIFEYKVIDKEKGEFSEQWKIIVSDDALDNVVNAINDPSSRKCRVTVSLPGDGAVPRGTAHIPAYVCQVNLYDEHLSLYASFKSDSNVVTVAVSELHLSGVF